MYVFRTLFDFVKYRNHGTEKERSVSRNRNLKSNSDSELSWNKLMNAVSGARRMRLFAHLTAYILFVKRT
jgi:hypothetical protein